MLTISRNVLHLKNASLDVVFVVVLSKFPHYWVLLQIYFYECGKFELKLIGCQRSEFSFKIKHRTKDNNGMVVHLARL